MSKAKQRQNRNIIIAVAVSAIIILALFMYTGYNPLQKANTVKGDYLTITVTYQNGAVETYTKENATRGTQLSILYNGVAVSSIATNLWITPTYTLGVNQAGETDSITSWNIAGTFDTYLTTSSTTNTKLYDKPNQPLQPLWTFSGQAPQPQLVSGVPVEVASATFTNTIMNGLYNGYQQGYIYNIYNSFSGQLTTNFAQTGADTETIMNSAGSTTITGMFQIEYISSSSISVTGAFAYS